MNFPPLPEVYFDRPAIKRRILEALEEEPIIVCVAGPNGSGRLTVLQEAVATDAVRRRFPGGIFYCPEDKAAGTEARLLVNRAVDLPDVPNLGENDVQIVIGTEAELNEKTTEMDAARWVNVAPLDAEESFAYLSSVAGPDFSRALADASYASHQGIWRNLDKIPVLAKLCDLQPLIESFRLLMAKARDDKEVDLAFFTALRPTTRRQLERLCASRQRVVPAYVVKGLNLSELNLFRKGELVAITADGDVNLDEEVHAHFHSVDASIHRELSLALGREPRHEFTRRNIIYHLVKGLEVSSAITQLRNAEFLIERCELDGFDALIEDLQLANLEDFRINLLAARQRSDRRSYQDFNIVSALAGSTDLEIARAAIRHNGPCTFVLVVGSDYTLNHLNRLACHAIGKALGEAKVGLITCGYTGVDEGVAEAYDSVAGPSLVHVMYPGSTAGLPGSIQITNYSKVHHEVYLADAVVLIGGGRYSEDIGNLCLEMRKAVFPFAPSGGAASAILSGMIRRDTPQNSPIANRSLSPEEFAKLVIAGLRVKPDLPEAM